jgi:hypothetical protein
MNYVDIAHFEFNWVDASQIEMASATKFTITKE